MTRIRNAAPDRYFLPEDYQHAREAVTYSDGSSPYRYWRPKRLKSTSTYHFQFPVYQYALKKILQHDCRSLVDIGCGSAAKLTYLYQKHPKLKIMGIDQKDAVDFCKAHHSFGIWITDNFDAPMVPDIPRSDIAICADVIEHVSNPDQLLSYISARVKPGGFIVLSTPDRVARYGRALKKPGHPNHVREWSYGELAQYLHYHGFEILAHFNQWPVRIAPSKVFAREILKQVRSRNKVRYNQICFLRNPA